MKKPRYFLWKKTNYEGEYANGKRNWKGQLISIFGDYLTFEGEFFYNEKRKGKEYYRNGKVKFEGEFLLGKPWNGKGYDFNGKLI